jgi:agmatine deiminase
MKNMHRRLPAEWEKHAGTLLSFPHEGADWPGKYGAIQWAFVEIIRNVSRFEPVFLNIKSEEQKPKILEMLGKAKVDTSVIHFIIHPTNRNWMRDSGPIIVKTNDGSREALNFHFNGWAKYGNYRLDMHTAKAVADHFRIPLTRAMHENGHIVLEGGSIDINGKGTLITTEECLLDEKVQTRNPGFSRDDYAEVFRKYLGITNIIWLGAGIEGDDTHGHVDDICRFVNSDTVVCCSEQNSKDPNHKKMKSNLERLRSAKLESGQKVTIIEIPLPGRVEFEGMRLPASYVNFLITNGSVLVPTFNDKNDYKALGMLNEVFPDREVIGIHALDLVWGLGTLHCLSHEIPA